MTDYNAFTDRIARNYAIRRAEQEEQRREEEQRRAQQPRQRSSSEQMIYKTYDNSPAPQPQQVYTMDEASAVAWNSWADQKIADWFRAFAPQINKEFDALTVEINQALRDLREALACEREKNTKLRSDIEVLRVMVRSQNAGVTMRSSRDAA